MSDKKTHAEKTSAADKAVGFDFQFYYFLYRLLNLQIGESVGLEVDDDVSTKLQNDRQILVQLKHTVQTYATGSLKALTTLDSDLWKTISNWSKMISDKNAGRSTVLLQLAFINKTDFLLVSNKSDNQNNDFLNLISKFKKDEIGFDDLLKAVSALDSSNEEIKKYIDAFLSLDIEVAKAFCKNLHFELDVNDIIKRCKDTIKAKMVDESKVDSIFHQLDSQIKQDNYQTILSKKLIIFTFEEFHRKYKRYFDLARSSELQIEEIDGNSYLQTDLDKQTFIGQLIDVGDIEVDDTSSIAEYTRLLIRAKTNIDNWLHRGQITNLEIEALHKEAIAKWNVEFKQHHKNAKTEEDIKQNGRTVLYHIRKEQIKWKSGHLDTEMSHGEFYHLSDIPQIGWHADWVKKRKK